VDRESDAQPLVDGHRLDGVEIDDLHVALLFEEQ
jgi:hypothetical protein